MIVSPAEPVCRNVRWKQSQKEHLMSSTPTPALIAAPAPQYARLKQYRRNNQVSYLFSHPETGCEKK